jgi:hypothetical protein
MCIYTQTHTDTHTHTFGINPLGRIWPWDGSSRHVYRTHSIENTFYIPRASDGAASGAHALNPS